MARLVLCAILALAGCAAKQHPRQSVPVETQAVRDTLSYWDRAIGWRGEFSLAIDKKTTKLMPDNNRLQFGECVSGGSKRSVVMFARSIELWAPQDYYACFRSVLTHEIIHAHLTCSPGDHTKSGIMAPEADDCAFEIDDETIHKVQDYHVRSD